MSSLVLAQPNQALACELRFLYDWPTTNMAVVYKSFLKNHALPLRLLVENEIFRLSVWNNPTNDLKRGVDPACVTEKAIVDNVGHLRIQMRYALLN